MNAEDKELEAIRARMRAELEKDLARRAAVPTGVVEATDTDLDALLARVPVAFIDLWATWCGPCKAFAPVFEQAAAEFAGKAAFVKVDVDANPVTSHKHQVQSVPTLLVVKDGQVVHRQAGALPGPLFRQLVQRFVV